MRKPPAVLTGHALRSSMTTMALASILLIACGAPAVSSEPPPAPSEENPVATPSQEDSVAERPAWRWVGSPPPADPQDQQVSAQGVQCALRDAEGQRTIQCTGQASWDHSEALETMPTAATIAAHESAGLLLVARYSPISFGGNLTAYDLMTGAERWTISLRALGLIGHSQYANAIELDLREGVVMVRGWESEGRYIELRRTVDGSFIRSWRADTQNENWVPTS